LINIEDLGIQEGISEMIITTLSNDGVPNAAPMGLHKKGNRLFLRIYASQTLNNISGNPRAVANIIDDPILFVESALSDLMHAKFKFEEGFPILNDAQGWILFDCAIKKGDNISVVELFPIKTKINKRVIKPINRGFNAVIEALIQATRYVSMKDEKFLEKIECYNTIVQKCGGGKDKEAMKLLYGLARLDHLKDRQVNKD
jgi:hypothetical protein